MRSRLLGSRCKKKLLPTARREELTGSVKLGEKEEERGLHSLFADFFRKQISYFGQEKLE